MQNTIAAAKPGLKTKIIVGGAALVAAEVLPPLFHAVGAVSGLGSGLGETFLPMQLPVILAGLLAGPLAGLAVGVVSPLISYALSGMPVAAMLPFILVELAAYGLAAGLLAAPRMSVFLKLLIVQAAGRLVRITAVVIAALAGGHAVELGQMLHFAVVGLPGILLQWCLIPLFVFYVERKTSGDR